MTMGLPEIEKQVGGIWARALGVKQVAPDGNFFALGGHSLLAVKMIAEIQQKLVPDGEVKLSDLFEAPTLAGFSARLHELMQAGEESGEL
jgi:hydroxymethylpyrimidine/phosphomethylpyrimidine kinase